jgi:hypothetical protein
MNENYTPNKLRDYQLQQSLDSFETMIRTGEAMQNDDGERIALRYIGTNPDMIIHLKQHQLWAMADDGTNCGKKLFIVDCLIYPDDYQLSEERKDDWKLIGKTNEQTDILGLFNPDSIRRNDKDPDKRLHFLTVGKAFDAAEEYLLSTPVTRNEIIAKMKKEGQALIEYAIAKRKEFQEKYPEIPIRKINPSAPNPAL